MSKESLQRLLADLHQEVGNTCIDAETRNLIGELDSELHKLLEKHAAETSTASALQQARRLEAKFAARHPTIEAFMREMVDVLAHMGI